MQIRPEDLAVDSNTPVPILLDTDTVNKQDEYPHSDRGAHWLTRMWDQVEAEIVLPALSGAVSLHRTDSDDSLRINDGSIAPTVTTQSPAPPHFKAVFDGVLLSTPGADTQHWHRDSGVKTTDISHYSIYIPTVDVTPQMGPTEFLPGTNRDFQFQFEDWTSMFDYCDTTERPLLTAGKQ